MTTPARRPVLLLVDDEEAVRELVGRFARRAGFEVLGCADGNSAIELMSVRRADMAMVDLRMPGPDGIEVLRAIRKADSTCQVVLMTGYSTIDSAVEAIKLGARDYLTKPLNFERLEQLFEGIREEHAQRQSVMAIERDVARQLEFCAMIGRGPAMQDLFSLIRRLAPHFRSALVMGETGSGKELVARALHKMGMRRDKRFVTINCAAVVETLFESELFGHVRGAFTGASEAKPGLFEFAEHGTLFLDEVGELPMTVQAKLLRILELGEVQRVGSLESRRVDVQIIAATNRDLAREVGAGRFRSDLYYRLNVVSLRVPSLRDRREDIPYLTAHFIREFSRQLQKPLLGVTTGAERLLHAAVWAGNVRELRNVIERACILADGDLLTEREIQECLVPVPGGPPMATTHEFRVPARADADVEPLSVMERDYVVRALQQSRGNKKAAAKLLGLSRRAFYRRLERYQLDDVIQRRPGSPGSPDSPDNDRLADDEAVAC